MAAKEMADKLQLPDDVMIGKEKTIEERVEGTAAEEKTNTIQEAVRDEAAKAPKTLNIMLFGIRGVGKSATGNSILGQEDVFDDNSGSSVIKTCKKVHGERFGENICVIDTPSACDTDGEDTCIVIDKFIAEKECELHVICLVISARNRPTKEEMSAITRLYVLFGPAMLAHLLVVVTCEEDLRRHKKTAKDLLRAYIGAGADLLKDCVKDDRVVGLDNYREEWREKQVQTLLQKTKEIVAKNKGPLYTAALFMENKKKLEKQQEEIRREKQELKEEKERLERVKRNGEDEGANRKVRLEEQEEAARIRKEEIKDLQQRHERERQRQEEETNRLRKEFEKQTIIAEAMAAEEKKRKEEEALQRQREQGRQIRKAAEEAEQMKQEENRRECERLKAWEENLKKDEEVLKKKAEEDRKKKAEEEALRQEEEKKLQEDKERIRKQEEELRRKQEDFDRERKQYEANHRRTEEVAEEKILASLANDGTPGSVMKGMQSEAASRSLTSSADPHLTPPSDPHHPPRSLPEVPALVPTSHCTTVAARPAMEMMQYTPASADRMEGTSTSIPSVPGSQETEDYTASQRGACRQPGVSSFVIKTVTSTSTEVMLPSHMPMSQQLQAVAQIVRTQSGGLPQPQHASVVTPTLKKNDALDAAIGHVAKNIENNDWCKLNFSLGLTSKDLDEIKHEHPGNMFSQILRGLQKWRQAEGSGATVQTLKSKLIANQLMSLAEELRDYDMS